MSTVGKELMKKSIMKQADHLIFISLTIETMPPKNPLNQLLGRNPARQFANSSEVPIAKCRQCLFKTMCLENEKNPTIRRLVLDEDITDEDVERYEALRDCGL